MASIAGLELYVWEWGKIQSYGYAAALQIATPPTMDQNDKPPGNRRFTTSTLPGSASSAIPGTTNSIFQYIPMFHGVRL